jgi:hypothetical protein
MFKAACDANHPFSLTSPSQTAPLPLFSRGSATGRKIEMTPLPNHASPSRPHATADTIAGMDNDFAARCRLSQTVTSWLRKRIYAAGILFGLSRLATDDPARFVDAVFLVGLGAAFLYSELFDRRSRVD